MKKLIAAILTLFLLFSSCAMADMLLPDLHTIVNQVELPSLRRCTLTNPTKEETMNDGSKKVTFEGITEEIYNSFSSYLYERGCTLADYDIVDNVITMTLAKGSSSFTFEYNFESLEAVVLYPKVLMRKL